MNVGQVVFTYLVLGIEHILLGLDHLLFVLVLLMLINSPKKLIYTITAFTFAHSITLVLAALEIVVIPVPPVEACIALSIVYVASEVIAAKKNKEILTLRRPWLVAFAFGLLHGLGFAAALSEIGLPQNAIAVALLVFNIGVEVGQLIFVLIMVLLQNILLRLEWYKKTYSSNLFPYLIGSLASFWLIQRVASF